MSRGSNKWNQLRKQIARYHNDTKLENYETARSITGGLRSYDPGARGDVNLSNSTSICLFRGTFWIENINLEKFGEDPFCQLHKYT